MNRGLLVRALRESWSVTLVLALVLAAIEAALAFVLPRFGSQLPAQWLQMGMIRGLLQAMLGTRIADQLGPEMFHSIAWVDPLPLALMWAHAMISCTRVPAGEVDRGTVDVILGLPVSRWELFFCETLVWLGCALVLMFAALAGNLLGSLGVPVQDRPHVGKLLMVLLNVFCLYCTIGGLSWFVSSLSERRGKALTTLFLIILALFLLNYLAEFWQPLERFVFLTPLHYHRPVEILAAGTGPWRDLLVLLGAGVVMWVTAGVIFSRRDLATT